VIHKRWCRNPENYAGVKVLGDSLNLILKSGITVATNQTEKDRKPWTGKRPPSENPAA